MGKRFRRGHGRRKEWKADNTHTERDKDQGFGKRGQYKDIEMVNEEFENYYKQQNIIPDQEEFNQFMECLRKQLPVTFRITGSRAYSEELRDSMIKDHFSKFETEELIANKPIAIPWYPNQLCWQVYSSRTELRKSPETAKFHKFLVSETEIGNISRQEAVSMIPPLLLDVQPHHYVFDMCAAPGSKTSQIIEALHSKDNGKIGHMPTGLVIANDADYDRSHMLVCQLKRLQSPSLIVTNHEAQFFPNIFVKPKENTNGQSTPLQFDRVLCDVPCSGDGTLRKNRMIWKNWSARPGNGLHPLQKQIFVRGCQLLKVGGRIVYSTCSFNPVEDEAVVCAVLNECQGSLRLVDVSKELPELKRRPGMTTWKCAGKGKDTTTNMTKLYSSYEEVPEDEKKDFEETMFPPKNISELNIERCLRIFPHLQDTGGFFVAVFEKVAPYGSLDLYEKKKLEKAQAKEEHENRVAEAMKEEKKTDGSEVEASEVKSDEEGTETKRRKLNNFQAQKELRIPEPSQDENKKVFSIEQPFIFLSEEDANIMAIKEFYGLDPSFPSNQWVVRSEGGNHRTIYFISESVKSILNAEDSHRILVVNTGVKMFYRNEGDGNVRCVYRLVNDGLNTLVPYLSKKRKVNVKFDDIRVLLEEDYPVVYKFGEETKVLLEALEQGSCLFCFQPTEEDKKNCSIRNQLILPVWKARASVNLLMKKAEKRSLTWRLLGKELVERSGILIKTNVGKKTEEETKTEEVKTEEVKVDEVKKEEEKEEAKTESKE